MSKSPQIEYRGNCHCGAFKFILKVPELKQALTCNCSICFKNGYMWAFPASTGDLIVVKGDENESLKSYEFGQRSTMYKLCATCGTSVLGRMPNAPIGRSSIGVNIRALADVNLDALAIITNNGSATKPEYQPPEPVAVGYVPEGTTVYTGNCHCGAVAYTLLAPEKITKATDCDCSVCSRDAAVWTYQETSAITFRGSDSMWEYTFGVGTSHWYCKICGVAIRETFNYAEDKNNTALNIRTMNGLDWVI